MGVVGVFAVVSCQVVLHPASFVPAAVLLLDVVPIQSNVHHEYNVCFVVLEVGEKVLHLVIVCI